MGRWVDGGTVDESMLAWWVLANRWRAYMAGGCMWVAWSPDPPDVVSPPCVACWLFPLYVP